jgi:hypothetical protein
LGLAVGDEKSAESWLSEKFEHVTVSGESGKSLAGHNRRARPECVSQLLFQGMTTKSNAASDQPFFWRAGEVLMLKATFGI